MQIGSDTDWKMINGKNDLFAIKTNGTLWYWNSNWDVFNIYPEQLGMTTFKDVASGINEYVIYAIAENGNLYKANDTWNNIIPNLYLDTSANSNCQSAETIEIEKNNFLRVSPNPTSHFITIKGENNMNQNFTIFDQMGREVINDKLNGISTEVNLSILSKGVYTLKIEGNYQPAQIVKE